MATVETDVLVVGSGPAGASMALALSRYGIDNIVITRYGNLAAEPRAHITNQRTMEIFRDLGVEQQVRAQATPQHLIGTTTYCTSLAGAELGRVRSWGNEPLVQAAHELASPSRICDMPQYLLEPVLVDAAVAGGSKVRMETEYLGHTQDSDGVEVRVRDRLRGDEYTIRARYLYGADGGRSLVAKNSQLPMTGRSGVAGSMNIVFRADLSQYVAHRPSVLYWMLQPGSTVGGLGMGTIRMVRPWNLWMAMWGYDIEQGAPELSESYTREIVRDLVGDPELDVEIVQSSAWTVNHESADVYSAGRVFCGGDAVHRHPPSNGLGSNTSVQDSYNLAWKFAHVLRGTASPALLESYTAERAPIGRQVVDRANQSIADTSWIFEALQAGAATDADQVRSAIESLRETTPEAEKRRRELREAIAFKTYEFNAHGVELNQRYRSNAVVPDEQGGADPLDSASDTELHHLPCTAPGAHLPHAWLTAAGREMSTLDIGGSGRFALLTGLGGELWQDAAETVAERLGVRIEVAVIGPGCRYEDPYGDWARILEDDGLGEPGALLVRPDNFVCYRTTGLPADAGSVLADVVAQVLGRA
ncbi:FAD-dependent monooxygenase [Saccharopolyspora sp. HNM0986]|uniref:FAD-dependent oxidoreductase n=1 Tax=Saccharopolyspora galaxeae TaxID=2781241 RepID=UPI00190CF911|nr:FAD-dependent monooxygenase [Saccharopolyspora sp. HNM0986]MBK0868339.1 FAD-dependent monooxygenase [Saccharopolyspora sp. HNM0986]